MPNTEEIVLKIVFDYGGEVSVSKIAREARLSTDYIRMICQSLVRRGSIDCQMGWCTLKDKGRAVAKGAAFKIKKSQTLVSGRSFSRTGSGRTMLDY